MITIKRTIKRSDAIVNAILAPLPSTESLEIDRIGRNLKGTGDVKSRLSKVVHTIINCFIGKDDEDLGKLTKYIDRLIIMDPKTAAQILLRLLPKQTKIDIDVDIEQRMKSAIVIFNPNNQEKIAS